MALIDGTLDQLIEASVLVTVISAADFEADQRDKDWHDFLTASESHLVRLQRGARSD